MNTPPPTERLSDDEFKDLVLRAVAQPDAPPAWRQAALGAWQYRARLQGATPSAAAPATLPGLVAQALQAVRRLGATLTFDSWAASPLATGLRGLRSDTRQFLYSTEGRDIDLRIAAAGDVFSLGGQILGPDETGTVELRLQPEADATEPQGRYRATLDEMGEFHIAGVAPGCYLLTLQLAGDEITLPPVQVGPPPD